jgi:hypothetical protein
MIGIHKWRASCLKRYGMSDTEAQPRPENRDESFNA